MAQIPYRANLGASTFPLISSLQGRSVIVPQQDQAYQPYVNPRENVSEVIGIPQIYFAENVMPSTHGLQSIAYKSLIPAPPGPKTFNDIISIVSTDGVHTYLAQATDGTVWTVDPTTTLWREINNSAPLSSFISVATVNGVSYIWLKGVGPFQYDYAANTLNSITFTGLVYEEIIGIISTNGYIVVYSDKSNAWSSTVDVTDFVPSLSTGAGGGDVQEAEGAIVFALPTGLGYILYTTKNAVSVTYSGNTRYPFNFRAISGAGGIQAAAEVAAGSATGEQYAYTSSGLQRITHVKADTILSYITDFISGNIVETYNEVNDTFTLIHLLSPLRKKIAYISDRYLIISYGVTDYTHAIVMDMVQTRMGRLKANHHRVFEISDIAIGSRALARQSVGFLRADGKIDYLSFDIEDPDSKGVVYLGKYAVMRARKTTVQEIHLENCQIGSTLDVTLLTSLDGKTITYKNAPYLAEATSDYRHYLTDVTGTNHTLSIKGAFNLHSLELIFTLHGRM